MRRLLVAAAEGTPPVELRFRKRQGPEGYVKTSGYAKLKTAADAVKIVTKLNGRSHNYVRFLQAHVASEPKAGTALLPPPPSLETPYNDPVDPNRVLVMNLPLNFSNDDIAAVFESCGRVSGIERIVPADSGMFEGCAYVSFGNAFRSDETREGVLAMDGTIPQAQVHGPAAAVMAAAMGGAAISVLPDPMGADHLDSWTVLVNKPTKFSDEQCQVLKQQFATRCGGHRIEFQKKLTQTQVKDEESGCAWCQSWWY